MDLEKIKGADLLCVEKRRWEESELGEVPVEVKRLNQQFAAATLAIPGAAKERGGVVTEAPSPVWTFGGVRITSLPYPLIFNFQFSKTSRFQLDYSPHLFWRLFYFCPTIPVSHGHNNQPLFIF